MVNPTLPAKRDPKEIIIPSFMPFFWFACAIVAGSLLADLLKISWYAWFVLLVICLILWFLHNHYKQRIYVSDRIPLAAIAFMICLGGLRYQVAQKPITPLQSAYYNERGSVDIIGLVKTAPEEFDFAENLVIEVESLTPLSSDEPLVTPEDVRGRVLLQVMPGSDYAYGDRLSIKGNLQTPPENVSFSYRDYLARHGIQSLMSFAQVRRMESGQGKPLLQLIYELKARSKNTLNQIFASPEAELLSGILLGDDSQLSSELKAAYQLTGTMHIIAISGFNIALLAGLITTICNRWLGIWRGTIVAIVILALYTILVGAEASVVRAAIMGGFGMVGVLIGRRGNGMNSLGVAAFFMCLINPTLPWDVGFQLSLFASLGLVIYAQPLQARFEAFIDRFISKDWGKLLIRPISEYLLFTLIAQVFVLPLIAYHFGELSLLFLLANPLILPAQPLVMILGALALLGGLLSPFLGSLLAWLAWPFAAYTNRMVSWLALTFPGATSLSDFRFIWVAVYYVLLFVFSLSKNPKAAFRWLVQPNRLVFYLGCLSVLSWSLVFSAPKGQLSFEVLAGSNNPVVLIESPTGRFLLLNGAVPGSALKESLGKALPFNHRELDFLVIPSCRKDDVDGLVGLSEHVSIGTALWACDPERIQTTRRLYQDMQADKVIQATFTEGDWLDLGQDASLKLLDNGSEETYIQVNWEDFSALMVFGKPMLKYYEKTSPHSLLILPGQTEPDDLDITKIEEMHPQAVILSVDKQQLPLDGSFLLSDLLNGFSIIRTDQLGWVNVRTDGQQMWLFSQKRPLN